MKKARPKKNRSPNVRFKSKRGVLEVYRDKDRRWWWRIRAGSRIVAASIHGFVRQVDVFRNLRIIESCYGAADARESAPEEF